jgi:hypothetical protein
MSRSSSLACATSRSRSRATAAAPSSSSVIATAACSAAARRWSRSHPRRGSTRRSGQRSPRPPCAWPPPSATPASARSSFLVDVDRPARFAFIEANPRLQVEHTVTEAVTGLDLVAVQLGLAGGRSLADLCLEQAHVPRPRGFAVQLRVNAETLAPDGSVRPGSGTLAAFEVPTGPGVRVDTCGYAGYRPSPSFDSLLAKVVVSGVAVDLPRVLTQGAARALRVPHRRRADEPPAAPHPRPPPRTRRISRHHELPRRASRGAARRRRRRAAPALVRRTGHVAGRAGARVDRDDPLAVLVHGKTAGADGARPGATDAERPRGRRRRARAHAGHDRRRRREQRATRSRRALSS